MYASPYVGFPEKYETGKNNLFENQIHDKKMILQRQWCLENKLDYIPVILFNDFLFPNEYQLSDILYFGENLKIY